MFTNEEMEQQKTLKKAGKKEEEKSYEITDLPPKAQRFVHLYMTGQYKLSKIAELLDVHPNTLTNWLKRDDVRAIIADMQDTTHEMVDMQLKALTVNAVNRLNDLVDSPIDGVALQAVNSVLDRGGHKQKQEIKIDKTVRTFEEKLQDVIENTIDIDEAEDVEYEDVPDEDGGEDE